MRNEVTPPPNNQRQTPGIRERGGRDLVLGSPVWSQGTATMTLAITAHNAAPTNQPARRPAAGILAGMTIATWIVAIATTALAIEGGTALAQWGARWHARAEQLRTDTARRENALHRQRFTEVWRWWHDQPDGPDRTEAIRWYDEWTGAARPRRGGLDDGPQAPGLHSPGVGDAYERYVEFLGAVYEPGRLGPPRPPLQAGE